MINNIIFISLSDRIDEYILDLWVLFFMFNNLLGETSVVYRSFWVNRLLIEYWF